MAELKYKRVLLKLSGEALAGETKHGINADTIGKICDRVKELVNLGAEVAIVVGGGNFWRGKNGHDMERTTSDYMGMLATCMNGLALQDTLEAKGVPAILQTSIEMTVVAERYTKRNAEKHLSNKRVVIFSGGTGSPFFTTDTATAISLCKDNNIPLIVFAIDEPENMIKAIKGEKVGTFVGNKN